MIVVSNTTPLNYLVLIDAVEVLPALFERIHVPEAVLLELGHSRAPALFREWAARLPGWVQAHSLTTQPVPRWRSSRPASGKRSCSPPISAQT